MTFIDVWNVETFDDDLLELLWAATGLIQQYLETDHRLFLEREASNHQVYPPSNPYSKPYQALKESLMPFMAERSIRAWHYTRMTDEEVQAMQREGLILSSLEGIKKRLSAQVSAGIILAQNAQRIFESSPFHEQGDIRSGQFWMTSNPISTQSCLVELLLNNWGGEGIYFWQKDTEIKSLLQTIGKARIIEIRAPLDATNSIYSAASNILSTFAGFIGCKSEERGFDFCVTRPLKPEAILHIHSQGDATFEVMGRGYPEGFIETPIE